MNRRSISNSIVRLAALGTILASGSRLVAQERPLPPLAEYSIRLSDSIVFEVDPRIELLSGAQSATSWVRDSRGPGGGDNRYFNELSALFKPFSGSRGVRESQAMTRRGFSYDAPPAFVLSLDGGAAMLPPAEGWSEYLVRRAGSAARLDAFASALAKLYEDAEFEGFLAKHEEDYRRWLSEASDGFDAASVSAWIEDFYGRPSIPAEYRFVFAPAMFPGGGYGFSRVVGDGDDRRMLVYQVVRAQGSADGGPGFPSGSSLAMLGLHEFGHSFVNPALERYAEDPRFKRGLEAIFAPVADTMRKQAYGQMPVFLNELVLRAACVIAERDLGLRTPLSADIGMRSEHGKGFYPIRRVVELLEEYRAGAGRFPDFASFAPVLLERLSSEAEDIVRRGAREGYAGSISAGAPAVESLAEGFELAGGVGAGESPTPYGFAVDIGATCGGGDGSASRIGYDTVSPGSGARSLVLAGDAATSEWYYLSRPISPMKGTLTLRYKARGTRIQKEGSQFGGSYVGFVITEKTGKNRFAVRVHAGSFPWEGFTVETPIDPASIASIELAVFLNETGELSVDDIEVSYR